MESASNLTDNIIVVDERLNEINIKIVFKTMGAICLALLTILPNLGIIWYEHVVADAYRTLINKMISSASAYSVAFATFCLIPLSIIFSTEDGFSTTLCRMFFAASSSCLIALQLIHTEIVLLRYIYLCRLKSVGLFKEDVVKAMLHTFNFMTGVFLGTIASFLTNEKRFVFAFCCSGNAYQAMQSIKEDKDNPLGLELTEKLVFHTIYFGTMTMNAVVEVVMMYSKRKRAKVQPIVVIQVENVAVNQDSSSLLDTMSSLTYILSPMVPIILATVDGAPLVLARSVVIAVVIFVIPVTIYFRKPHVRTTLLREIKSLF